MRSHVLAIPTLATLTSICCLTPLTVTAQIVPDNTLGSENSVVTPNVNIRGINSEAPGGAATLRIDGGAVRGGNLFHSFQEFNVDEGRGVYFSNPDNIINILTRVTGGNISEILGTLGVLGNANLFLINPNGIVFGPNASLDIGGSFFATTADGVLFENGIEFAASNPEAPPLLTINIPLGLNIRENPGTIVNQSIAVDSEDNSVGLQVLPKRTLGFVGGDIQIQGGILTAPQGRIELGSVEGNSLVSLTPIDKGYALGYENVQNFQDIALSQQALVDVRGEGGGDIQIQGQRVILTESSVIEASTQGSEPGGLLNIQASESVEVVGSRIFADVDSGATAIGGSLIIDTQRLVVQDGGQILTSTFGNGNAGDLTVTAADVELIGTSADGQTSSGLFAVVASGGTGNGGTLAINTQNLRVQDGARVSASTFGNGNGGALTVTAADVELIGTSADGQTSSGLFASVGEGVTGNGGIIIINTQNLRVQDGASISASTGGNGNGGDLLINTQNLQVRDASIVTADTFAQGDAGNLTITATDVEVVGTSTDGQAASALGTSVGQGAVGNAGTLTINTQNLRVQDSGQISAATNGQGDGGDLNITANTIELIGALSFLFTTVESEGVGNAGTLTINTQRLLVQDGGQISAATNGQGDGANLTVNATDVELIGTTADGQLPSGLFASVDNGATGNGGTLTLNTQRLTVRDGAQINTTAFANGDAGDLIVNATDIELVGTSADGQISSGLLADVEPESTGKGGELRVNADNLTIRDGASIDVRSEGIEAAGNLEINAPNILLDNEASLNAETTAGQGNIILNTSDLRLRNNSNITTNAIGEATGGNIEINTDNLIAIEDSDISANAEAAFGGRVIIDANAIFGTQFRQQQTGASDITATSELGPEFSGTVDLDSEIDPAQGLVDLPQTIVDPAALIAQDPCKLGADSEFFITGRGGLVPDPTEELAIIEGFVEWESSITESVTPQVNPSSQRRQQRSRKRDSNRDNYPVDSRTIVPARGWIRNEKGEVILVGYDPTKTGVSRQLNNLDTCQSSN